MEVGQQLSEARRRRNLTLADLSRTTKISVHVLDAIERNDIGHLPHGFFTRAFVRTYAKEVGVDANALLGNVVLGEIEEAAVETPATTIPIQESSSSRSLFFVLAFLGACTIFYSGFASQFYSGFVSPAPPAPVPPPVAVASMPDRVEPAAFAPPPCAPVIPADTPVRSVRRPATAVPSTLVSPVQSIPVTHVVPRNEVDTSAASVDSSPAVSDAIVPTPDPIPSPAPIEQF
jgi:cytoskeleton protein RodZ